MKLTYDPEHNVAYLRLHEKTTGVKTVRLSDSVCLDMAPDGTLYGIELLNANEQLVGEDGALVVVNEAAGDRIELPLTRSAMKVKEPKPRYGSRRRCKGNGL